MARSPGPGKALVHVARSGEVSAVFEPDAFEAHTLRLAGTPWRTIAVKLGYQSPTHAQVAVFNYQRRELVKRDAERKATELATELDRIDALQTSWWTLALLGDDKAAGVVLKCIAQRARLLGLELPEQSHERTEHTVTVVKGDTDVYIESLRSVVEGRT